MAKDIFWRLALCTGFDWGAGKVPKLQERHQVTSGECEQIFFQEPLLIVSDDRHAEKEERWAALGRTAEGRALAIMFTLRGALIRPVSVRNMNRKERQRYAKSTP